MRTEKFGTICPFSEPTPAFALLPLILCRYMKTATTASNIEANTKIDPNRLCLGARNLFAIFLPAYDISPDIRD